MAHTTNRTHRIHVGRLVVIALVLLALSIAAAAASSGTWVRSQSSGCPEGQVCADWEVDGVVQSSCCIDPLYLGSSFTGACATSR